MEKKNTSEYDSNLEDDIDHLSEIYSSVDNFATVMTTLDDILNEAINLYEEIEELTICKSILENQLTTNSYNEIYSEIQNITNILSEKEMSLEIIIGNARNISTNI